MSKKPTEINDDEIRIISADDSKKSGGGNIVKTRYIVIVIAVILISVLCWFLVDNSEQDDYEPVPLPYFPEEVVDTYIEKEADVSVQDTVIQGVNLLILTPENARPRLVIGTEQLSDSGIILATQAADVRGDNGKIAGTFVLNGELVSRGEAKAGFCSIVNGELAIGVADATPMLEQTLTDGGYFFRQYPLVVGGQIVENKPKGRAIRKALAEIGGKTCVVMTRDRLTFHDFSQLLIDLGARNAIYLVGSVSYGFYVNEKGERIPTGAKPESFLENVNFIVWE